MERECELNCISNSNFELQLELELQRTLTDYFLNFSDQEISDHALVVPHSLSIFYGLWCHWFRIGSSLPLLGFITSGAVRRSYLHIIILTAWLLLCHKFVVCNVSTPLSLYDRNVDITALLQILSPCVIFSWDLFGCPLSSVWIYQDWGKCGTMYFKF